MDKFTRRRYYIEKRFQRKFILKFCSIVLVAGILLAAGILYFSKDSNTVTIADTKIEVQQTTEFILPILGITLSVVLVFTSIAVVILTLFTSHKIAGPLFRLSREINDLGEGDFHRNFSIRGGDQLQALSVTLDEMCHKLKKKHIHLQDSFRTLKNFMTAHNFCLVHKDTDECINILKDVQTALDEFKA